MCIYIYRYTRTMPHIPHWPVRELSRSTLRMRLKNDCRMWTLFIVASTLAHGQHTGAALLRQLCVRSVSRCVWLMVLRLHGCSTINVEAKCT